MRSREFSSPGIGGLTLHSRAWLPDGLVEGVIVLAHGLGEHCGRYDALATTLTQHGFAVYALDHRGHGRSMGGRANIDRFAHLVSDYSAFAGRASKQHPEIPVYLLGHSMGGAVAFAAALRPHSTYAGLILSAPALSAGDAVGGFRVLVARLLSMIAPGVGALKIEPGSVSRDPNVVREYADDPLVFHGAVPARTVVELLDAMEEFPQRAPRLSLPLLVLHGTADKLVPLGPNKPIYQAIGSRDKTLRIYDGLYHEVFNEPERAQVIADTVAWLKS